MGGSSTTKPPTGICAPGHAAILWTPGASGGDTQCGRCTHPPDREAPEAAVACPTARLQPSEPELPAAPLCAGPSNTSLSPQHTASLRTVLSHTHPWKLLPNAWYEVPVSATNMTGKRALPRTRQLAEGLGKSLILTRMEVKFATCLHGEPKPRMFASNSLRTHGLHPGPKPASEDSPTAHTPTPGVHHHPGSGHDCLAAPREFRGPGSALP